MSKRTGKAISLSRSAGRGQLWTPPGGTSTPSPDTQMEFDLGLAVREDSENPIYYVEYAHARICSLLRALEEEGVTSVPGEGGPDACCPARRRRPSSSRSPSSARRSSWRPETTIPATSTAASRSWRAASTASTPPAASRARSPPVAGGPAEAGGRHPHCAEKRSDASSAWTRRRKCNLFQRCKIVQLSPKEEPVGSFFVP